MLADLRSKRKMTYGQTPKNLPRVTFEEFKN